MRGDPELNATAHPGPALDCLPKEWLDLLPFGRSLPAPPSFPIGVLPDWLGDWIAAEAVATQTPPELAAVAAIGAIAACTTGRMWFEPRTGWKEPACLYLCAIAAPGERKSAVVSAATQPLHEAEETLANQVIPDQIAARAEQASRERAVADARKELDPNDPATAENLASASSALAEVRIPPTPVLLVEDATPEALVQLAAEQGGVAIISAEGGVFEVMGGRYRADGTGSLEIYLKAHAGEFHRERRVGREGHTVQSLCFTLVFAIQPDVLASLAANPKLNGRGLLARFGFVLPESPVGRRTIRPEPVSPAIAGAYAANLGMIAEELYRLPMSATIRFSPEADDILAAYEAEIEPRLDPRTGDLAHMTGWASKLAGLTVRFAGLIHVAEFGATGEVNEQHMLAAVELGRFFTEHALRVWVHLGEDSVTAQARMVTSWLADRDRHGSAAVEVVTRREIHRAHRTLFPQSADLHPILVVLQAHRVVRRVPRDSTPGRPSERFEIHPDLLTGLTEVDAQP